jgi:hypothetical protein
VKVGKVHQEGAERRDRVSGLVQQDLSHAFGQGFTDGALEVLRISWVHGASYKSIN